MDDDEQEERYVVLTSYMLGSASRASLTASTSSDS
jgi:hypothetical protein